VLEHIGKIDEALSIHDHVFIVRNKLIEDHPNTVTTMHNMASVLDQIGRYDPVENSCPKSCKILQDLVRFWAKICKIAKRSCFYLILITIK
jgi:hypothetical protein